MAKVFTTVPGAVQRIGNYGEASNGQPAIVPDEVAAELATAEGLRVEQDSVRVIPPGVYSAEELAGEIEAPKRASKKER